MYESMCPQWPFHSYHTQGRMILSVVYIRIRILQGTDIQADSVENMGDLHVPLMYSSNQLSCTMDL